MFLLPLPSLITAESRGGEGGVVLAAAQAWSDVCPFLEDREVARVQALNRWILCRNSYSVSTSKL